MPVIWIEPYLQLDPSAYAEYKNGCFGWVNGTLYLDDVHHAKIIASMINGEFPDKYNWETLASAKQMWGWYEINDTRYDYYNNPSKPHYVGEISFATDDAKQSYGIKAQLASAFKEAYPGVSFHIEKGIGDTTQEDYGQRARQQYMGEEPDYDDEDY